jgi:hypothetical protein
VRAIFHSIRDNDQNIRSHLAEETIAFNYGFVNLNIVPSSYPVKEHFAGVIAVYFTFIDARLVQYTIQYGRPPWPRLDDFINRTADALKLPQADRWVADNPNRKLLTCDGFLIRASTQSGAEAYLSLLTGEDPNEIQRKRRAAAEEEARRVFKP